MTREDELLAALQRAQAANQGLSDQLDSYRIRFFGGIGSGIDVTKYDLIIVCRECGNVADPKAHACSP